MTRKPAERMAHILGLGFDAQDGHTRITRGDGYTIYLGSEMSHQEMQRVCHAIAEELKTQGKQLDDLTRAEFADLLQRLDV